MMGLPRTFKNGTILLNSSRLSLQRFKLRQDYNIISVGTLYLGPYIGIGRERLWRYPSRSFVFSAIVLFFIKK